MNSQVEEVKAKTDIVAIVGERVQLHKAGKNFKGLCPFHSEKTPSFMVSPELALFRCFGCGEAGDVLSFLQKFDSMDFPEALKYLADRAGIKLERSHFEKNDKQILYDINELSAQFYHYILVSHQAGKSALNYLLAARGLTKDSIKLFQIGFAPESPQALFTFLTHKKKIKPAEIIKSGVCVEVRGRVFDRFRGRVIFPIWDHRGNCVALAGRILPGAKKELAKYINSPETPVYHKSQILYGLNLTKNDIKKEEKAIIVEGEIDLISSHQAGIKNVAAIKGSALTEEQLKILGRFTKEIILALDSDFAGNTAAMRGISIAQREGLDVKVARLGDFKDPDEAAKDPQKYQELLAKSVSIWDFLIDLVFAKYDSKSGEGKAKISREVTQILTNINDKIVSAHYIGLVAQRLGVPPEAVSQEVSGKTSQDKPPKLVQTPAKQEPKNRRDLLEERLLTMLFQNKPDRLIDPAMKDLFHNPLHTRILEEFEKYFKNSSVNIADFAKILPPELMDGFSKFLMLEFGDFNDNEDKLKKEIKDTAKEIQILDIKEQLDAAVKDISQFEKVKNKQGLKTAEGQFTILSQKLSALEEGRFGSII